MKQQSKQKGREKKRHGLFSRLFFMRGPELSPLEEEEMQSPFRTVARNFCENKVAMTGLILFVLVFLFCFIYPVFNPLDLTFQDPSQQNLPPGFQISNVPKALKNNAVDLAAGSGFGVGVDKEGRLYEWGVLSDKLRALPKGMGKVKAVAAGQDHALAVNEDGKLFIWGNDRQGVGNIPAVVKTMKAARIAAGYQVSAAVGEDGRAAIWGNFNLTDARIPQSIQGQIAKIVLNATTGLALTTDGRVVCLASRTNALDKIPEEIQGRAADLAVTDRTAAAVLHDGQIVVWGGNDNQIRDVPAQAQGKATAITGGRSHFSVITDGGVLSWGGNNLGQSNAPEKARDIVSLSSGYYQNYAIDASGKVYPWGLKGYFMGTDQMGRDVAQRMISGGRMTMTIGAVSVIIATLIGIIVGGVSGYYGGRVDNLLMRFAEVVGSLPFLPLAMTLSGIIGNRLSDLQRILMIMVVLGVLSWPGLARLVRAQILAEREKEFVTAARAMGIREMTIIFRHIIPNVITVIIVNTTLNFAACLLTESGLSFLGFGVTEPSATWGNMLNSCRSSEVIGSYWWRWVFPSIALSLSTISINCVGDGLRDAIDPKSNER